MRKSWEKDGELCRELVGYDEFKQPIYKTFCNYTYECSHNESYSCCREACERAKPIGEELESPSENIDNDIVLLIESLKSYEPILDRGIRFAIGTLPVDLLNIESKSTSYPKEYDYSGLPQQSYYAYHEKTVEERSDSLEELILRSELGSNKLSYTICDVSGRVLCKDEIDEVLLKGLASGNIAEIDDIQVCLQNLSTGFYFLWVHGKKTKILPIFK